MLFLPKYYGISISSSLPVLTVLRLMYVILYIYAFLNRRNNLNILHTGAISKAYLFLAGYFVLRIIANLYYITTTGEAIKAIFEIIFEQLFFLIAIYMLSPTRHEIEIIIRIVVWSSFVMFIIGILESFTLTNPFDNLYTVSKDMLNDHFMRLGLLRSTTTMALPGIYANMCVIVFPLILYLYNSTLKKRYLFVCLSDIFAIIHSGSRAGIFFFFFIVITYFLLVLKGAAKRKSFFKNSLLLLTAIAVIICTLSFISPYYRFFYEGSGKAVLNEVGFKFDINNSSPNKDVTYGENRNYGSVSRLTQFTGIYYALRKNPVFGLGARSTARGVLQYYSANHWHTSSYMDVGYVEIICNEGIVGMLGYIFLIISFVYLYFISNEPQLYKKCIALMAISYFTCILSTANMYTFLFLILILFMVPINAKETKEII